MDGLVWKKCVMGGLVREAKDSITSGLAQKDGFVQNGTKPYSVG